MNTGVGLYFFTCSPSLSRSGCSCDPGTDGGCCNVASQGAQQPAGNTYRFEGVGMELSELLAVQRQVGEATGCINMRCGEKTKIKLTAAADPGSYLGRTHPFQEVFSLRPLI